MRSSFAGELSETSADASSAPKTDEALPAGRYLEGGELGRGGMGRVRAAWDPVLRRTLAVKRAKDDSADAEQRLLDEARITASLDHPGIITVLDAGRGADGGLYYVMRVVEGVSLAEVLATPRPLTERVRLLLDVAQALASAHEHGVVHRDLSPANVRVGKHGEVVVLDWGLAALVSEAAKGGVRCGTPGFVAPELMEGRPVSPAADVYSLGVLLHLALTGTREPAPRPRAVPRELWSIVTRCLERDASRRYSTAAGLEADLRAWLDGERVQAHPERVWSPLARWTRRHPMAFVVGGVSALVLAAVTTTLGLEASRARAAAVESAARLLTGQLDAALGRDDVLGARRAATELAAVLPDSPASVGGLAAVARTGGVSSAPGVELVDVLGPASLVRRDGRLFVQREAEEPLEVQGMAVEAAAFVSPNVVVAFGVFDEQSGLRLVDLRTRSTLAEVVTGGGLQTLRRADTNRVVVAALVTAVVFADETSLQLVDVCPASAQARFALPGRRTRDAFVMCGDSARGVVDGEVVQLEGGGAAIRGPIRGVATNAGLVVGTVDGVLGLLDAATGRVRRTVASAVGPVRDVAALDGEVVVVAGRDGLGFWRSDLDAWVELEPPVEVLRGAGAAVVTRRDGAWRRWSRTSETWHRANVGAGVTAMVVVGDQLISAGADSVIRFHDVATGRFASLQRPHGGVISSLARAPSGEHLVVATAGEFGVDVVKVQARSFVAGDWSRELLRARWADFVDDTTFLTVDYGGTARWFSLSSGQQVGGDVALPTVHLADFAIDRATGRAWALSKEGQVFAVEQTGARPVFVVRGATALAWADGLVVATSSGVERRAASGEVLEERALPGAVVTDVAVAPDGSWAVSRLDGRVEVVSSARKTLTLAAHQSRASTVVFGSAERLFTAGWDGVVRVLELHR